MKRHIDSIFNGYLLATGLSAAPPDQRTELRQAFFAGASSVFHLVMEKAGDWSVLDAINAELKAFGAELDERCKQLMTVEHGAPGPEPRGGGTFVDLEALTEDQRIDAIGQATLQGNVVGVMIERSDHLKVERYLRKVTTRYPGVRLIEKVPGGGGKLVVLKFGPVLNG